MADLYRRHLVVRACLILTLRGVLFVRMVSLGIVRFPLSGKAAVGTMLGVVLLVVVVRRRFNSSDIPVVNVS